MTLTSQNIGRHQKKTKNPATTQKWTHSFWKFSLLFFFGAFAGLVHLVLFFFCFFLVLVQVWCIYWFVFFDACAGFGDSRLCMFGSWPYFKLSQKQTYRYLWIAIPPHRLPDLNIQQLDTRLCLLGFLSLSLCLTIEMRLLTRLCKITMINEICTYFLNCNIPTILLIQSVRCACVISTYIMYALPTVLLM